MNDKQAIVLNLAVVTAAKSVLTLPPPQQQQNKSHYDNIESVWHVTYIWGRHTAVDLFPNKTKKNRNQI